MAPNVHVATVLHPGHLATQPATGKTFHNLSVTKRIKTQNIFFQITDIIQGGQQYVLW